jgi:hypothetical protein
MKKLKTIKDIYGQFIISFANTKELSDVGAVMAEYIPKILGFDPFKDKSQLDLFPENTTIYTSMNWTEKTLFNALCNIKLPLYPKRIGGYEQNAKAAIRKLERTDPSFTRKRYEEICQEAEKFYKCLPLTKIEMHRNQLFKLLESIYRGDKLYTIKTLKNLTNSNKPKLEITSDSIIEAPLRLSEQDFISRSYKPYRRILSFCVVEFFREPNNRARIKKCEECGNFYISQRLTPSRFCSTKCRLAFHNRKRIESGDNRKYKEKKRKEGAKASYYGQ